MSKKESSEAEILFLEALSKGLTKELNLVVLGGMILTLFPALSYMGFPIFDIQIPIYSKTLIWSISIVGGIGAYSLYYPQRKYWYTGILPGIIHGFLSPLIAFLYFEGKESVDVAMLFLPFGVSILPAGIIYYIHLRAVAIAEFTQIYKSVKSNQTDSISSNASKIVLNKESRQL